MKNIGGLKIGTMNEFIEEAKHKRMIKESNVFGKWQVSKNGDMNFEDGKYFIESAILTNDDWIIHLDGKAWIDWNDFIPAYFQACKNAGNEFVKMRIFYK